jgi:hypothetical protein
MESTGRLSRFSLYRPEPRTIKGNSRMHLTGLKCRDRIQRHGDRNGKESSHYFARRDAGASSCGSTCNRVQFKASPPTNAQQRDCAMLRPTLYSRPSLPALECAAASLVEVMQ